MLSPRNVFHERCGFSRIQSFQTQQIEAYSFRGFEAAWEAYNGKAPTETFKDQVRIKYELIMKNGKWKVHGPDEAPHISVEVALKNEETLLAESPNGSDDQKSYRQIVEALRKLSNK